MLFMRQVCRRDNDGTLELPDQLADKIEKVARIKVDGDDRMPDVCLVELENFSHSRDMAPFLQALQRLRARAGEHNSIQTLVVPAVNEPSLGDEALQSVDIWNYFADMVIHRQRPESNGCYKIFPYTSHLQHQLGIEASCILPISDSADAKVIPFVLEAQNISIISRAPTAGRTGSLLRTLLHLHDIRVSADRRLAGEEMWSALAQMQYPAPLHRSRSGKFVLIGATKGSRGPHALTTWSTSIMNPYPALINALHDASRRLHSTTSLAIVDPSTFWRKIREADGTIIPDSHNDTSPCATKANIAIAGYARMHKIPFLGIGTGMHAAVEDFARNVCDIPHPVPTKKGFLSPMIQHRVRRNAEGEGGGAQEIYIPPSGLSTSNSGNYKAQAAFRAIYGEQAIVARERFESNGGDKRRIHPEYVNIMRTCGFDFFCQNEDGVRLDAFRYTSIQHPFYVGVGFPPEYSIRILRGSDVMFIYVRAVFEYELKKEEEQE